MDGPAPHQLTATLSGRRSDALAIVRAAIGAVSPARLLAAASSTVATEHPGIRRWHVVAVGKAAAGLYTALAAAPPTPLGQAVVIGPVRPATWPGEVPFIVGGHPYATDGSFDGARRALALAESVPADEGLLCLLSGGASALMAAPVEGLDLATKQRAVAHVMTGGADITALNALRKHLSRVKGGRLAAACPGLSRTFAVSDVIGDDLSVIGSGPTVPDPSTWRDARDAAARHGGLDGLPPAVRAMLDDGVAGRRDETPKPGDPRLARARAEVIGGRHDAMQGARAAAATLGYDVVVIEAPVRGEAREAAATWWRAALAARPRSSRPCAIVTSGETTVRVRGRGRGGRNQEFAAALVAALDGHAGAPVVASVGTDGIDGPTDAAGALVDAASAARARGAGQDVEAALADNDCYPCLEALGDLLRLGPTGTNVGDLQILLLDPA